MKHSKEELITTLFHNTHARDYKIFVEQLQYLEPQIELVAPPHWRGENDYESNHNGTHPTWSCCFDYVLIKHLGTERKFKTVQEIQMQLEKTTEQTEDSLETSQEGDVIIYTNPAWLTFGFTGDNFQYAYMKSGLHHWGIIRKDKSLRVESKWGYKGPALLHPPNCLPLFWQGDITIRRIKP